MNHSETTFPTTKYIFSDVFNLLRQRAGKLSILVIAITIASMVFAELLNFDLSYESLAGFAREVRQNQTPAQISHFTGVGIAALMLMHANLYFMLLLTAIIIVIVTKPPSSSLTDILLEAHPHAVPLFTTTILMFILFLGGMGLFLLPGLALFILFILLEQVVVLKKQRNWQALQTALTLFWRNRSFVFSKLVAMALAIIGLLVMSEVLQLATTGVLSDQLTEAVIPILRFLTSAIQHILTVTTLVVLFKIVDKRTNLKNPISLFWLKIICAIGYIGSFFLGWWIIRDLTSV